MIWRASARGARLLVLLVEGYVVSPDGQEGKMAWNDRIMASSRPGWLPFSAAGSISQGGKPSA
jgi:hypothetical protein